MSRWLDLARDAEEISKPLPDTPTKGDKTPAEPESTPFCRVLSGCRVGKSEKHQPSRVFNEPPRAPGVSPYGRTICGRPKTWTGKIVSLADWRNLSDWERHGSTGKMWNGLTQEWR